MSTPTEPNSADRALWSKIWDLWCTQGGSDSGERAIWSVIAAHRSSAVAEAVAGLERECKTLKEQREFEMMRHAVTLTTIEGGPSIPNDNEYQSLANRKAGELRAERDSLKQAVAELEDEIADLKGAVSIHDRSANDQMFQKRKAESERDGLRALVVRLQDALKDTQEVIDIVKDFEVGEAEGPCAANRAHAIGLIVESALISVPADLADCVCVKRGEWERTPDLGKLMRDAHAQYVRPSTLWPKFIDGTPLNNDISVWMAEFARDAILADRAALRPEAKGGAK